MKKKLKLLIFVILSTVFNGSYGQSSNKIVNSNLNLRIDVNVINDSIKSIRKDFETYKTILKAEYDNKIDAVNQENDGRYQVLGFCAGLVLTLLLAVLVYFKIDANDKIKSGIVVAFDEKFEKDKKKIEAIYEESVKLLEKLKENESAAKLQKNQISEDDLIKLKNELEEKIKQKEREIETLRQKETAKILGQLGQKTKKNY